MATTENQTEKKYVETPLMKQYYAIKAQHPDVILLFRVGDFYETFGEDAIKASAILGITLTRRANGQASFVELAGFPYHSVETYLPKLVRAGERVAICEQLEDPKSVKGIVKRGIVELVTPGVALSDNILSSNENTFLASVYFGAKEIGVAFLDISTGEYFVGQGDEAYVDRLIANFAPKEVLYQRGMEERLASAFGRKLYTYRLDEWVFGEQSNHEKLTKQLGAKSLKGFGIEGMTAGVTAAGAILYYLELTEHRQTGHITTISRIDPDKYVWIDRFTIRNLELFSANDTTKPTSFVSTIDRTTTRMGARLLRRWIALPLRNTKEIARRSDIVELLKNDTETGESVCSLLSEIGDIERTASRIATMRALPRELVGLRNSLCAISSIKELLSTHSDDRLQALAARLTAMPEVVERIEQTIYPDPSNNVTKGGVVADGVDMELDDLRRIANHGKELIADIVERESAATGIPSLKVSFNNVFGYYIEVRNAYKERVPAEWTRKQTLTAAERYITAELKEYEEKILGAEERMSIIEQRIYSELMIYLGSWLQTIQSNAAAIAETDCLLGFARIATERGYCRAEVNDGELIEIMAARHPVIETLMATGEAYVPNDLYLDSSSQQIIIITGPNMSGKSALLRQTALIVLMAQMGSFVPASSATIGAVDKIFTRVGASDNISQGESTFMVEMLESASILNNISDRSLVLLDEIGRGTSTYDGISIAWAMVEYLHNSRKGHPKTLFATHYHELNELEEILPRVKNYNVSVREVDRNIIFMRKLVRGGTAHSFGIHVAKMAGMPAAVVKSAERMLELMESRRGTEPISSSTPKSKGKKNITDTMQLTMFQLDDPVLSEVGEQIRDLDINSLTPIEALNKLNEIKKIIGK